MTPPVEKKNRQRELKRSNKGCLTCRERRVKCNEERPSCSHCTRLKRPCVWREHVPLRERRAGSAKRQPPKQLAPRCEMGLEFYAPHLVDSIPTTSQGMLSPAPSFDLWPMAAPVPDSDPADGLAISNLSVTSPPPMSCPGWTLHPSPLPLADMALASRGLLSPLSGRFTPTDAELRALHYFQVQARFGFGSKSPEWSIHRILLTTTAHIPVIYHLLVAASLAECVSYAQTCHISLLEIADNHYEYGRTLLRQMLLAQSEPDPLVVMASFWFLYLHQRRWHSRRRIHYAKLSKWMCKYLNTRRRLHLELSLRHTNMGETQDIDEYSLLSPERRAILARLIIWLFWADTQASLVGGGRMAQMIAESVSFEGVLNLHETSRAALQLHWKDAYPEKELLDDLQNAAALELIHHTWALVQQINQEVPNAPMTPEKNFKIDSALDALQLKYSTVFALAKSMTTPRTRPVANADWAVATFYSVRIYAFRCSMTEDMNSFYLVGSECIDKTVSSLISLLRSSLEADDKQQIDRLQWALVWAGLEATDASDQQFILSRLSNPVAKQVVQEIFDEQSNGTRASMQRMGDICQTKCQLFEGQHSPVASP